MKTAILTGGGTAGHVTPIVALIAHLKAMGLGLHYVGSSAGIERKLIEPRGVPFHQTYQDRERYRQSISHRHAPDGIQGVLEQLRALTSKTGT